MTEELERFIREKDLNKYDGLTKSTRRRLQRAGLYPRFIRMGANMVALPLSRLKIWQQGLLAAADADREENPVEKLKDDPRAVRRLRGRQPSAPA